MSRPVTLGRDSGFHDILSLLIVTGVLEKAMKRKAKYIIQEQAQLVCPVCKEVVRPALTQLKRIADWLDTKWFFRGGEHFMQEVTSGKFRGWACIRCEHAKRAVFPDYSKQNYGLGGPILFYITKEMNCESCKKDFIFTAEDQRFWYEDLYFNYSSYPKNCLSCRKDTRKKKALHQQLAELLHDDPKTAERMRAIASVYEQLGIEEKAKLYRARAKNLER